MKIVALIIGIDGWNEYTAPLVAGIQDHEPDCQIVVIDNHSQRPYPAMPYVHYTDRLCYAKAINAAASFAPDADWYIILSNDVACTGEFSEMVSRLDPECIYGGEMYTFYDAIPFVMGWCVITSRAMFERVGGWDENYVVSSWEDVDYSEAVRKAGGQLDVIGGLPFKHLDQRQRFGLPEFAGTHERNKDYFLKKWKYQ